MSFTLCPSWCSAASRLGLASAASCCGFALTCTPCVSLSASTNFCLAFWGMGLFGMARISMIASALHLPELGRALTVRTRSAGPPPGTATRCLLVRSLKPTHVPSIQSDLTDNFCFVLVTLFQLLSLTGFAQTCSPNSKTNALNHRWRIR